MSIAHELSSEVAAAVLAAEGGDTESGADERARVVLEVHSTLRKLSDEYRRKAQAGVGESRDKLPEKGAASGGA